MVELNSDNKMNEETQQNKIANKPMSPRSQARSRSMSSEKDGILRPYDKDLGAHGSASNESAIQQTKNNLPPDSNRVSRPMERGLRRPPSASVTRTKQRLQIKRKTRDLKINTHVPKITRSQNKIRLDIQLRHTRPRKLQLIIVAQVRVTKILSVRLMYHRRRCL